MRPATRAVFGSPRRLPRSLLSFLLILVTLSCCLQDHPSDAQTLPQSEVDALKQIAAKLKIPAALWNFSLDPCHGRATTDEEHALVVSNLTCGDCNATTGACHVVSIRLKGQNLTGVLPEEFGKLTSLIEIDLTRNYINGSIPAAAWANLPLLNISLPGNRLTGPIPEEIGEITTLQSLVLENNMLRGPLPPGLGKLASITRLFLSANNFTGELPEALGNLRNLSDFRIDGNDISGKIPSFIGNWTKLRRFDMQGTSLEGPFPSIFSTLLTITELRVTDLKKTDGSFPPLEKMRNMEQLVLRNCSISGEIPKFIGNMPHLKRLYGSANIFHLINLMIKCYLFHFMFTWYYPL